MEESYLVPILFGILTKMRGELKNCISKFSTGPMSQGLKDVDFFITVTLNLLNSENFNPLDEQQEHDVEIVYLRKFYYPKDESKNIIRTLIGDDKLMEKTFRACIEMKDYHFYLFGKERTIDTTMFQPRGHYSKSSTLRQYFRAMTWLGKIDMNIAGEGSSNQQLASAIVLYMLLTNDKEAEKNFQIFNKITEALFGPPNSMDMTILGQLLDNLFKLKNFEEINSEDQLTSLQTAILATQHGIKNYNNTADNGRRFSFMGQKFAIDSWAQSKVITDCPANGHKIMFNGEVVERHVTSSIDTAFAVLSNNDAASIIHQRIANPSGTNKYRDGFNYHPYLVATRKTIDELPKQTWTTSIYNYWLNSLRQLSVPLDDRYPQAMRTQAYAMKKLTTQVASWAQLRHDSVLYVEQLSRCMASCEYPDGYVEPFVEFWEAIGKMSMAMADVVGNIKNIKIIYSNDEYDQKNYNRQIDSMVEFFCHFAKIVTVLREISAKELHQQPLRDEEINFMKTIVERESVGSGGDVQWTGWYPSLYFEGYEEIEDTDCIVSDVYSNPPCDCGDTGCVVHQGLSNPRRIGKSVTAYAGPVFDYYEFELPGLQRLTDEKWKEKVAAADMPSFPEWTTSYLVASK